MAASLQSLLLALEHSNGAAALPSRTCRAGPCMIWAPPRPGAAERLHAARRRIQKRRRRRRVVVVLEGSRKPRWGRIERSIRDLRRLVPLGEAAAGVDGLLLGAADYIESLRMQVEVMQLLVKVLSRGQL